MCIPGNVTLSMGEKLITGQTWVGRPLPKGVMTGWGAGRRGVTQSWKRDQHWQDVPKLLSATWLFLSHQDLRASKPSRSTAPVWQGLAVDSSVAWTKVFPLQYCQCCRDPPQDLSPRCLLHARGTQTFLHAPCAKAKPSTSPAGR